MDRHFPTLDDVLGEATYKTKQLGTRKATSPFLQSAPGPLVADWSTGTARSSKVHAARTREIFVKGAAGLHSISGAKAVSLPFRP